MTDMDKEELAFLKKIINEKNAHHFDWEGKLNKEFNTRSIQQYDPIGSAVINEFNFSSPEGLKAAQDVVRTFTGE